MSTAERNLWTESTSPTINTFTQFIVDTTASFCSSIQHFVEECPPTALRMVERIQHIASPILAVLGSLILFAAQSSLFTIGFLISIMSPKIVQGSLHRISDIWGSQRIVIRTTIIAAAVIAWPISLAASAFFVGGRVGLALQLRRPHARVR